MALLPPLHPTRARPRVRLPRWSWAYVAFRLGDGASSSLVALAVVVHYHLPLWALALTTAAMNLVGVPAAFLWGSLVDRGVDRRRLVTGGFALAGLAMAALSWLPGFPLFLAGVIVYTAFGVATAPAASTMVLQGVPRSQWSLHTSGLSRRTGFAYLTGMLVTVCLGLLRVLDMGHLFALTAATSLLAAILAWRLVPHYQPPLPHEPDYDPNVVRQSARKFERPVYFPGRLRYVPSLRGVLASLRDPARLWPLGYALTFMGSVSFFTSYTGVLSDELGIGAGLVLLAQAPSNLLSPIAYPWAGRHGLRVGESLGVVRGSVLRMLTIPVMAMLIAGVGASALPLLLVLHGVMGVSFALIQVNGPILLAQVHPKGRGQGVGTYHAAVGVGTLLGALVAFLLLRAYPYPTSYLFSVGMSLVGGACLYRAHRGWVRANSNGTPAAEGEARPSAAQQPT